MLRLGACDDNEVKSFNRFLPSVTKDRHAST